MVKIEEIDYQQFESYASSTGIPSETLLEQIEARKKAQQRVPTRSSQRPLQSSSQSYTQKPTFTEDDLTPFGKFMFDLLDLTQYLIPLVFVHAALNILVRLQYGQDMLPGEIFLQALVTVPVMTVVHLMAHPYNEHRWFRIIAFFSTVGISCYLLHCIYEEAYYAVMRKTPSLGTILIWLLLELDWQWCATALVVIASFMWRKGYSIS